MARSGCVDLGLGYSVFQGWLQTGKRSKFLEQVFDFGYITDFFVSLAKFMDLKDKGKK